MAENDYQFFGRPDYEGDLLEAIQAQERRGWELVTIMPPRERGGDYVAVMRKPK